MLTRFCLFFFALFMVQCITAKELPSGYDAPVILSKIDQLRLKRANDVINQGRDIWNNLNVKYNPEEIISYKMDSTFNSDAYPILIKAAKLFLEGNRLKYTIYHGNCLDFWKKHRYEHPTGLDNAKKFQKEASGYMDSALLNRRVADNYNNMYVQAYNRYFEAISLEVIATKKEARALQIYRDWPAHYSYDWDEDVETNLFAVIPKIEEEKTLETTPDSVKSVPSLVVKETADSTNIYYSIQIAAHTIPMTEAHIRANIYLGPMLIREIWEAGWYKYLIGHFKNLDEVILLLKKIEVEKAFVVVYKNGKRIALKDLNQPQPAINP